MPPSARTDVDGALVDHVCHVHNGARSVRAHGVPFLAGGLRLGQRPVVLAPDDQLGLARQMADDAVAMAGGGPRAEIAPLGAVFGDGPVDIGPTLQRFATVLDTALADGFVGIRVLSLVTEAVRDPAGRRAFAAWEHVAGAWQSSLPIATACVYDRSALGDAAVQELACLHPRSTGPGLTVPFRLYVRRGQLVLEGEVDSFAAPLLRLAVAHVRPTPGRRLVVDARGLTFVDHRGIEALVEGLARRVAGLTLLGTRALPAPLRAHLGVPEDVLDVLPWVG